MWVIGILLDCDIVRLASFFEVATVKVLPTLPSHRGLSNHFERSSRNDAPGCGCCSLTISSSSLRSCMIDQAPLKELRHRSTLPVAAGDREQGCEGARAPTYPRTIATPLPPWSRPLSALCNASASSRCVGGCRALLPSVAWRGHPAPARRPQSPTISLALRLRDTTAARRHRPRGGGQRRPHSCALRAPRPAAKHSTAHCTAQETRTPAALSLPGLWTHNRSTTTSTLCQLTADQLIRTVGLLRIEV